MLKEIQFQRSKQTIFEMDEDYNVIKSFECRDAFIDGWNEAGMPRNSLPNDVYEHVYAEYPEDAKMCNGPAYGCFYIHTGDYRGRDIHGGGSGCVDPYADYQELLPTYGCLRMYNRDGVELSWDIINSGNDVVLTVVD